MLNKELQDECLRLASDGVNGGEIARRLKVNRRTVYGWLHKADIWRGDVFYVSDSEKETIINLRESGLSYKEIADKLDISVSRVDRICKKYKIRISDEARKRIRVKAHDSLKLSNEEVALRVSTNTHGRWTYIEGYKNCDSSIVIECSKCHKRSVIVAQSIFRESCCPLCKYCVSVEKSEQERIQKYEARKQKLYNSLQKELIKELDEIDSMVKVCNKCGAYIYGKRIQQCLECKAESELKNKRAHYHRAEVKRRLRIKTAMVDKDINLISLYDRDKGICHLCGAKCDLDDKEEIDGVIICGNSYPSIDHVIPLAKGGLHSWDNVKLAHRLCNSIKADN